MNWYYDFVRNYPIGSAMLQFAILGTLGGCVAKCVQEKRIYFPLKLKEAIWYPISWAILAIMIKMAFIGFGGFLDSLIYEGYLPLAFDSYHNRFLHAFALSALMNLQFGPLLVIFHRWLDYLPFGKTDWSNIDKALKSLLWWWIPAHTVTFLLPQDLQIGMAAVWSLVLGFILGFLNKKKKK